MKSAFVASLVIALASAGNCLAQVPAPPPNCNRESNELHCLLYYGTLSKSQSDTGITGNPTKTDNSQQYVIFLHSNKNAALAAEVARVLAEKKYMVRGIDDQSVVSGAGIDFFRLEDKPAAEAITALVNESLKKQLPQGAPTLVARLQASVSNPAGYIGVWLPDGGPTVRGWYYLGKISKDKKVWLDSSAKDSLTFDPAIPSGANIVDRLKGGGTVASSGYKYLRSVEGVTGKRVQSKVTTTLAPNVKARIVEVDASGVDPADGETVLWALIEVAR